MNPTMMNPEISQGPNVLRRVSVALTITAAALGGAACGDAANNEAALIGNPTTIEATSTTGAEATSTTTTPNSVLDGSDAAIAADRHITRCGVDEVWSANSEAYILNQESNLDLLRSKEQVFFEKVGVNAANILVDNAYTFDDVATEFTKSDSFYTRLIARADAVQMTDAAVAEQPSRQNFRCDDQDNDGVGDESIYRDDRANVNKGENVTLLALTLSPEDWKLAVEAAYVDGIDLNAVLLNQTELIAAKDAEGKDVMQEVVRVFFEDDSCGNQVFVSNPPELPPMIVTTTEYVPPKNDTGTILTIPGAPDKESDPGAGDPVGAGKGPAGQDVDPTTGTIAGESPVNTQAPATTEAPKTTSPNTVPATTGTQPITSEVPVTTSQSTIPNNNGTTPAPAPLG